MGRQGLKRVAELCFHKSHYAAARAAEIDGIAVNPQAPGKPFFKEFVLRLPRPAAEVNRVLLDKFDIIGGVDLATFNERLSNHMLVAVTETARRADIDRLIEGLKEATR
jgi:glycine dehydrogenase subunit 1